MQQLDRIEQKLDLLIALFNADGKRKTRAELETHVEERLKKMSIKSVGREFESPYRLQYQRVADIS